MSDQEAEMVDEQEESITDHAVRLAAHAVKLAAFWNSVGPMRAEGLVDVLAAAYELGNPKQFASVLCEVAEPDDAYALDIVKAFVQRVAA